MLYLAFGLLLLSWLNPLHIGPWVSWHNEALAFGAASLISFVVFAQTRKKSVPLRIPASAAIWLALIALVAVQVALGQIDFLGDGILLVLYLLLFFTVVTCGYSLGAPASPASEEVPVLSQLASVVLLGAVLSSVVAIIQTLDVWSESEWISRAYSLRRPGGNIAQPNQLATLQLMGVVSLNYLLALRKFRGAAALLMYILLIAGVALTESRSGILSAATLLVFGLVYRQHALGERSSLQIVAGFVLLVLGFKYLPVLSFQLQNIGALGDPTISANLNAGTRLSIWPQLLEASLLHPWFGWGLRQVPMAHNAVLHNYTVGEAFTYAHCIVLDLVLGVGYPLAVVFVVMGSLWAIKRIRAIKSPSAWFCMALLVPFAVHSLLEFPFAYAYFLVPVGLALGVFEARLPKQKYIDISWRSAAACGALVLAALAWSVWEYVAIEEDFRVARFEALRIGKTEAVYERPNIIMFTQMAAVLDAIRLVPVPGMSTERIESIRKVAMRFPWVATQNRYALTLALNGDVGEAIRQLQVMRAMHGEKTYEGIKSSWEELANTKYPQLKETLIP